jgi:hypothetical protein
MDRLQRIATRSAGILAVIAALIILPPLWRYWSWYPKLWSAKVQVDARPASQTRVYADRKKERFLVVNNESAQRELYYIGSLHAAWFVLPCDSAAFSFAPGLAFSNHVQFGRGCLAGNIVAEDAEGNPLETPKRHPAPDLKMYRRAMEFTAKDGKRIHVA